MRTLRVVNPESEMTEDESTILISKTADTVEQALRIVNELETEVFYGLNLRIALLNYLRSGQHNQFGEDLLDFLAYVRDERNRTPNVNTDGS